MTSLLLGILGLCMGSFISALVWRLHSSLSFVGRLKQRLSMVKGRSMCPHCHHQLSAFDLVPVLSWLWLRGRCRYCHRSISWHYPVTELLTGGLFILSYVAWPRDLIGGYEWAYFGLWLAGLVILLSLAVYDLRWMLLPDALNYPLMLVSLISVVVLGQIEGLESIKGQIKGVMLAWGMFASLYYLSRGQWLGGGDVKLSVSLGLWLGLPKAITGLLLAFYSATLIVLPLLLLRRLKRKQAVAFGPFLIAGLIFGQLYGRQLIDWYLDLFTLT